MVGCLWGGSYIKWSVSVNEGKEDGYERSMCMPPPLYEKNTMKPSSIFNWKARRMQRKDIEPWRQKVHSFLAPISNNGAHLC